MKNIKSGLAHGCHHDTHYEFCYDFDKRVEYIKNNKLKEEIPGRLKQFKMFPGELLPGKDSKEWEDYGKAREAYVKAREAHVSAWEAYEKAKHESRKV